VEKAAVCATSNLIDDIGFEVNVEGTGDVFSGRSLGEEGTESIVARRDSAFNQTAIRLTKTSVRKTRDKRVW
jgi:hypothetical protein